MTTPSPHEYLDNCEQVMMQRGNRATLNADRQRSQWVEQVGRQRCSTSSATTKNLQLETQTLAGHDAKELWVKSLTGT